MRGLPVINEIRRLKQQNEILMKGLQELANQPRLLCYGVMKDKHLGIDEERRKTVLIARELIKRAEEVK